MQRCVHTSTWCGLGLAGNMNFVAGGTYLGIACGLTQLREILGVWGVGVPITEG